jgi:hypothetical protein
MLRHAFVITASVIIALATSANAADVSNGSGGFKDGPETLYVPITIIESNNQVGVQFITTNFDYKETVNGAPFDTEKSWVPGVGFSLSLMRDWFVDNLYLRAQFSWESGKTDYVGAYRGDAFGSLVSTSGATVYDSDFRLGKGFAFHRDFMATPFFGVGYHQWDREINAGEDYSHSYAGGGLLVQWSYMSGFVLSVDGFVGGTLASQIKVATVPDQIVGSTLTLGNSAIYQVGLSGDYAVTRSLHVDARVEWVNFKYGQSAFDPTKTYVEPHSETSNVTVKVGVGYAFGNDYVPLK